MRRKWTPGLFAEELKEVAGVVFDDEVGHGVGLCGVGPKGNRDISRLQFRKGLLQIFDDQPGFDKAMGELGVLAQVRGVFVPQQFDRKSIAGKNDHGGLAEAGAHFLCKAQLLCIPVGTSFEVSDRQREESAFDAAERRIRPGDDSPCLQKREHSDRR